MPGIILRGIASTDGDISMLLIDIFLLWNGNIPWQILTIWNLQLQNH